MLKDFVVDNLSKRQLNSLRALQNNVENTYRGDNVRVSNAQYAAMQAAFNAAKLSGEVMPPEVIAAAARMGLK